MLRAKLPLGLGQPAKARLLNVMSNCWNCIWRASRIVKAPSNDRESMKQSHGSASKATAETSRPARVVYRYESAICAALLLVLTYVVFFTAPAITETIDYVYFYRPNFEFLITAVKNGAVPLWNPYI